MQPRPPCSRYENKNNADDGEERVIVIWAYALGLLGSRMEEVTESIARLHDHKGTLYVVTRRNLPEDSRWAFRRAWREIAYEVDENVEFVAVKSREWADCWNARRFDSDWAPD